MYLRDPPAFGQGCKRMHTAFTKDLGGGGVCGRDTLAWKIEMRGLLQGLEYIGVGYRTKEIMIFC